MMAGVLKEYDLLNDQLSGWKVQTDLSSGVMDLNHVTKQKRCILFPADVPDAMHKSDHRRAR